MKRWMMPISALVVVSLSILVFAGIVAAQPDPMSNMGSMGSSDPGQGSTTGSSNLDLQISGNSNSTSHQNGMKSMMEMANMMMQQKTAMDSMMNMMNMGMNMGSTMMNQMMGMDNMMMGMNNGSMSGSGGIDPNIIAQIQANNAMLSQMLLLLTNQTKDGNLQTQLQAITQLLASQATLIQMLNKGSMNMNQTGSGNSGGMSMGGMNMGGNSGGMGMM